LKKTIHPEKDSVVTGFEKESSGRIIEDIVSDWACQIPNITNQMTTKFPAHLHPDEKKSHSYRPSIPPGPFL
jgi:hypothetical protein